MSTEPGFIVQKSRDAIHVSAGKRSDQEQAFGVSRNKGDLEVNVFESFDGFTVHIFTESGVLEAAQRFSARTLLVGGGGRGGGGARSGAGGGGGGQVIEGDALLYGEMVVGIGKGGLGGQNSEMNNGEASVFLGRVALGGGAGGWGLSEEEWLTGQPPGIPWGSAGASGGGHAGTYPYVYDVDHHYVGMSSEHGKGGIGIAGHKGGSGFWGYESYGAPQPGGGGGGGAGDPGFDCYQEAINGTVIAGDGGPGVESDIVPLVTRPCPFYGAGGGGCWGVTTYSGGGGAGGSPWLPRPGGGFYYNTGGNLKPNTGGGWDGTDAAAWPHGGYQNSGSGGGGGTQAAYDGPNIGNGGSGADGILVVRYDGLPRATGGTIYLYDSEGNPVTYA